jgi:hypothetical protein
MLNTWSRAEHCRDLAEECRRLAKATLSSQMRRRYLLMAKDYSLLSDGEEQEQAYCARRRLQEIPRTQERLAGPAGSGHGSGSPGSRTDLPWMMPLAVDWAFLRVPARAQQTTGVPVSPQHRLANYKIWLY